MKQHPYIESILVGKDGTIYNKEKDQNLVWSKKPEGYFVVSTFVWEGDKKKQLRSYVHRLVAETYIPNPENKPQVNHKDLDKSNNHVDNLEWATAQENMYHSYQNREFDVNGENNPFAKLTEELVRGVCERLQDGHRNVDVAREFDIPTQTVSDIRCRKVWAWVGNDYDMKVNRRKRRSNGVVLEVAKLLEQGMTPRRVHNATKVSLGEVYDIKYRKIFADLTKDFKF